MGYIRELVVFSGVYLFAQELGWLIAVLCYLAYLSLAIWQESRRILASQAVIDRLLLERRRNRQ